AAVRCGEGEGRHRAVALPVRQLTDAVVAVPDRMPWRGVAGRARPLHRPGSEPVVGDAAHIPPGLRVPEPTQLVEDRFGRIEAEPGRISHGARDPADDLP